jgi:hypothetical protein
VYIYDRKRFSVVLTFSSLGGRMTEKTVDYHDYVEAAARFSWSESGYVGFEEPDIAAIADELSTVSELPPASEDLDYAVPAPRASTT